MQSLVSAEGVRGLVRDFLENKGRPGATWWRDRMGRSPSTRGERVEISDLRLLCRGPEENGHIFGYCPPWTAAVFGGIDVQKDCVKWLAKAYGAQGLRRAVVAAGEIKRDPAMHFEDVRKALLDIAPFPVMGANRTLPARWLIDSGYETRSVYQLVKDLERVLGPGRFIACKGMSSPESKPGMYTISHLREMKTPGGDKIMLPWDIELVQVNGHLYRDQRAPRLVPLDDDTLARLAADYPDTEAGRAELAALLARIEPVSFPGGMSWPDGLLDRVLAEIAEDEKVLIGRGSGRGGPDGMGRLRSVWRKRVEHRPNDWGDCDVYADACADRHGVMEWTSEMVDEAIARREMETAGGERAAAPRREARERTRTIAGDAARERIF